MFNEVVKNLIENKLRRERGEDVVIPYPFRRFSKYVAGIEQEMMIKVTANSKVGKTQLTDFLFLYSPFEYWRIRKSKINLKIYYFTLEMSKQRKIKQAISYFLNIYKNKRLSSQEIESKFIDKILSDEDLEKIKSLEEGFKEFESIVTFVDDLRTPTEIYNYLVKEANKYGKIASNEFRIAIFDHISLLLPEPNKHKNVHEAMEQFSSQYCLNLRDEHKYTLIDVHQQAMAQESVKNYELDRLQPSLDGLADNKIIGRNNNLILGLFNPNRYNIKRHGNYDIETLGDNFRELLVIGNREGECLSTPLYFDGAVNYFEELPNPGFEMEQIYAKIRLGKFKKNEVI